MIVGCALALVASAHLRADVDPAQQPLATASPLMQHEGTLAPHLQHEAEAEASSGYDVATVAYSSEGAGGCKASTVRTDGAAEAGTEQSVVGGEGKERHAPPLLDGRDARVLPHRAAQLSMYIAVMSRPQNRDQRDAIRQTWKKQIDSDPSVEVRFELCDKGEGVGRDQEHIMRVEEEKERYGDLQVLDCWEGYGHGNLTLKIYAVMEGFVTWSENKPGNTVFMKVDDDTLIRAGEVLEVARRVSTVAADFYMGHMYPAGQAPNRDKEHKWYEPCEVFKESKYPMTASGAGYVLSGSLVQRFVQQDVTAVRERLLWNEDRAVATWVQFEIEQRKIPVTYVNLPGVPDLQEGAQNGRWYNFQLPSMDDWRNLGILLVHKMYPKQMRCVWQRMQRGDPHAKDCVEAATTG